MFAFIHGEVDYELPSSSEQLYLGCRSCRRRVDVNQAPKFISRCLNGVNFPQDWWWALIGIKILAAVGLVVGAASHNASITTTVSVGVLSYFVFDIIAHVKANFLGQEFWVNCLGMTVFSAIVLVLNAAAM